MSRIGSKIITFDNKVVKLQYRNRVISVLGPKGKTKLVIPESISCILTDHSISLSSESKCKQVKEKWGTTRALLSNMIQGVTKGFTRKLNIVGVGYKVTIIDNILFLSLGLCHDIGYVIPDDVKIISDKNSIEVTGVSKQRVGDIASLIRSLKKPEPYKGKGIFYDGETVKRKEGKKR